MDLLHIYIEHGRSIPILEKHDRQTDGQKFYRIDAHLWGESAQKENGTISQLGVEKITSPPKPDIQPDRHTDIHTDGRTLAFIE